MFLTAARAGYEQTHERFYESRLERIQLCRSRRD
jgi:hypothetical protein